MKYFFILLLFIHSSIDVSSQGNVGIGLNLPFGKLHIKGDSDISQLIVQAHITQSSPLIKLRSNSGSDLLWIHSDAPSNTFIGYEAGTNHSGSGIYNTLVGAGAGFTNLGGSQNTATGYQALFLNNAGNSNTAYGYKALYFNATGFLNTAFGSQALYSNDHGDYNSAFGPEVMTSNTAGSFNTAIGFQALQENKTGNQATAIGMDAMRYANNTLTPFTNKNVAVGYAALQGHPNNTDNTGNSNTAIGYESLTANRTGNDNTAVGKGSLYRNTFGEGNTANGFETLSANTEGNNNTGSGYRSLYSNISGINNTAVGVNALYFNETGSQNTAVGRSAYFDLTGLSNTTCLGHTAGGIVDVSNRIEIGNTSVTWIGGEVGWSTYSDARIKDNVTANVPGLSFISRLRPVTYNLNIQRQNEMVHTGERLESDWPGKYDIEKIKMTGFIAQEVEQAANDAGYDFSGVEIPKDPNDLYSLRYSDFVVPLVKAVQEMNATDIDLRELISNQQEIIETLRTELETLKAEVAAMRDKKNSEQ